MSPVVYVPRARPGPVASAAQPLCRRVAAALLAGGSRLMAWADALAPAAPAPEAALPRLEFHAEACAVEGALYVDGQFVGRLEGVTRL